MRVGAVKLAKTDDSVVKTHTVFSRVYQQACSQHHGQRLSQGQVCMFDFDSFQDQQEILTQRSLDALVRIRHTFTPPPR